MTLIIYELHNFPFPGLVEMRNVFSNMNETNSLFVEKFQELCEKLKEIR